MDALASAEASRTGVYARLGEPGPVVDAGLRALDRGAPVAIPGLRNQALAFLPASPRAASSPQPPPGTSPRRPPGSGLDKTKPAPALGTARIPAPQGESDPAVPGRTN